MKDHLELCRLTKVQPDSMRVIIRRLAKRGKIKGFEKELVTGVIVDDRLSVEFDRAGPKLTLYKVSDEDAAFIIERSKSGGKCAKPRGKYKTKSQEKALALETEGMPEYRTEWANWYFGGASQLAVALKTPLKIVESWGEFVPPEFALKIKLIILSDAK